MSPTTPEVVRVGASGARILSVTKERVGYIDMAGQEQSIDLKECAGNWTRWHDNHRQDFHAVPGASQADVDAENARCVGQRGGSHPLWWAEFMNERKTRFEFGSWEALWQELYGPLMVAGWSTFDTN